MLVDVRGVYYHFIQLGLGYLAVVKMDNEILETESSQHVSDGRGIRESGGLRPLCVRRRRFK